MSEEGIAANATMTSSCYHFGLAKISFIVDTGSPETVISETDALRLNLPLNSLPFVKHIRLGGSVYELKKVRDIKLFFKDEENKIQTIIFDDLLVSVSTKEDTISKQIAQALPSIMGLNFLSRNRFKLCCIPHKNIAYFESTD